MKRTEEDYKNDMNSLYNLDATPENIEKLLEPYIEEAVQDMIDASNELDAYEEELVNSPEFKENVEIADVVAELVKDREFGLESSRPTPLLVRRR